MSAEEDLQNRRRPHTGSGDIKPKLAPVIQDLLTLAKTNPEANALVQKHKLAQLPLSALKFYEDNRQ